MKRLLYFSMEATGKIEIPIYRPGYLLLFCSQAAIEQNVFDISVKVESFDNEAWVLTHEYTWPREIMTVAPIHIKYGVRIAANKSRLVVDLGQNVVCLAAALDLDK